MSNEANAPAHGSAKSPAVAAQVAPPPDVDLSAEIIATIQTNPGETVKCVRVYGDSYRCNWWSSEEAPAATKRISTGLEITAQRVSRSSFLKVKKTAEGLMIHDVTSSMKESAGKN
jgi:hypothetical protein